MIKRGIVLVAGGVLLGSTLLYPPAARAQTPAAPTGQTPPGPYISLGAGIDFLQNQSLHGGPTQGQGLGFGGNLGGIGSASVGYSLGNGIRIELQGDYSSEAFYRGGAGQLQQYHGFANVLYDINGGLVGAPWLTPYVGLGGGYGASHLADNTLLGIGPGQTPFALRSSGTAANFTAQGIAGLSFNVGIPGLALTAEYHLLATPNDSSYEADLLESGTDTHAQFHTQALFNHVAMLGVRYALFPAAPAPLPAVPATTTAPAAPAPPDTTRTYLVFFDWDRADLSARARQIVAEAASASTKVPVTRIDVNGYTDSSGTAAYNQRLSIRRAESVEAELVRDGVPKDEISVRGLGENNPLVPTAKGVREPQNRRVEIILH